ncbi:MAG: C39 family peptidase [Clostridiales bacterium]|nr:C39 family peptidase [Clostridiales bacterium]
MKRLVASLLLLVLPISAAAIYLIWGAGSEKQVEADTGNKIEEYREEEDDNRDKKPRREEERTAEEIVADYAEDHLLERSMWPDEVVAMIDKNPETEKFVLEYPYHNGEADEVIDISGDLGDYSEVPAFYQWDQRWGYKTYGSNCMGVTGCGPTCLSMVAVYLTGDTSLNPAVIADYAMNNGYYDYEYMSGTFWTLMTDGANGLGFESIEITVDEDRMINNLNVGNPIVCIMGPGTFTTEGHFIVLTGYENGKFRINDPFSMENTQKEWEFDEFADQIECLWVMRNF